MSQMSAFRFTEYSGVLELRKGELLKIPLPRTRVNSVGGRPVAARPCYPTQLAGLEVLRYNRDAIVFEVALVAERVDDVGQVVVGPQRQRRVHHVEVQVGGCGVARVAQPAEHLSAPDVVTLLHRDATRHEVRVDGVA